MLQYMQVMSLDGTELSSDGRSEVMSQGASAFQLWESLLPKRADTSVVLLLKDNEPSVKTEAVNILVKLLTNVVNHPGELKYRQVRLGNKTIEEKLLPANGAFEILFSVGFEESSDSLVLPFSASIPRISDFHKALMSLKLGPPTSNQQPSSAPSLATSSVISSAPTPSSSLATSVPAQTSPGALAMPDILAAEKEFQQKLVGGLAHMESYENPAAQALALEA